MRTRHRLLILVIIIVIVITIIATLLLLNVKLKSTTKPQPMTENVTVRSQPRSRSRSQSPTGKRGPCKKLNEAECRRVFETRYKVPFPDMRPKWLPSPHSNRKLELDGYNPMNPALKYDECSSTGLAFEYDGIQHRKPGHFGMTQADVDKEQERDRHKDKLCKSYGITLIRVSDLVKFQDIESYLNIELDKYDQQRAKSKRYCVLM